MKKILKYCFGLSRPFWLGVCLLVSSSCASIFNKKQDKVRIISSQPVNILVNRDTVATESRGQTIWAPRQRKDLLVQIQNDTISREVLVPSRNSFPFYCNFLFNYGIGALIDWKNPKRYAYPKYVYVDLENPSPKAFFTYDPRSKKGNLDVHISLPFVNIFLSRPRDLQDRRNNTGLWGFSLGLDYYHRPHQYLNLSGSFAVNSTLPLAFDDESFERNSTFYLGLSQNHRLRKFRLGYGLSFAQNIWEFREADALSLAAIRGATLRRSHQTIGFLFPFYFLPGESFFVGLTYRPTFLRLDSGISLSYEHLISLEFGWKIKLKK